MSFLWICRSLEGGRAGEVLVGGRSIFKSLATGPDPWPYRLTESEAIADLATEGDCRLVPVATSPA